MNTLLAESGSTKTDFVVISGPEEGIRFYCSGLNPSYLNDNELVLEMARHLPVSLRGKIEEIFFYGAGCASQKANTRMVHAIQKGTAAKNAIVQHDLMAAARGLLGQNAGIAGIMGTGSHACIYNGDEIVAEATNMGHFFNDYGSGARLGRDLLELYYNQCLPPQLNSKLTEFIKDDRDAILENLYRKPGANRYLATFAHFINTEIDDDTTGILEELVMGQMNSFCEMTIAPLVGNSILELPLRVGLTGSIAWYFKPWLQRALQNLIGQDINLTVTQSPLEGLINWHVNENK